MFHNQHSDPTISNFCFKIKNHLHCKSAIKPQNKLILYVLCLVLFFCMDKFLHG
ncbi:hypothetical protein HAL09_00180 [Helicobacter ailurogastricus]|uniref:Uncharacterized protein n=1 Tax=Helicobacter ailurogastricus TaxID=1578720 RepID=A0A0K2XAD0_9HELI|nr:hypothetical protein HAL011_15930 [Helicobacter ailurogastricus]CRF43477.1 hypothetical protein HAL09_00180 [Helicobacter ailurogastricus]